MLSTQRILKEVTQKKRRKESKQIIATTTKHKDSWREKKGQENYKTNKSVTFNLHNSEDIWIQLNILSDSV